MTRFESRAILPLMTSRRWTLALMGLAIFCASVPSRADEPAEAREAGKKLLAEGDELADKGETTEALLRYKQAFEKLLPGMRKIPFKSEVLRDVTAREALKDVLLKEIDEDSTPEEFRADELGMKALGFLPLETNLKEVMIKIYSEEIAAFYDPKTKTMHLIKEPEARVQKKPSLLERLLGKTGGFDKDENKTVIAHELTHALADQNYDIDAMQKAIQDNDDQDLALSALIEGEATLTMIGAQMEDWEGSAVINVPAANLDRVFSIMTPLLPMTSGKSLREAPAILAESMIFPYLRGMVFCAKLTNDGGWDALNAAYKRPPLSTEQILHPEKYSAKPDLPTTVDLGKLDPGAGWKELGRNVVGEMQTAILLRRQGGKSAAAGWDGDRFAVFEGPEGKLGLVWFTTWDSEKDADEFQEAYVKFQTTKLGKQAKAPDPLTPSTRREHEIAMFAVEQSGVDVIVVEGFSAETTERLIAEALKSKKTEMSHDH